MDINEAKVNDHQQLVIDKELLTVCTSSGQPTLDLDNKLLDELAKRWNAYREMVKFLEKIENVFNCAILRTPTGEVRNECTDLNIERMQFIVESKVAPPTEEKDDR